MNFYIVTYGHAGYTHDGWSYVKINAESEKDMLLKFIARYFDEENELPEIRFSEMDQDSLQEYVYYNLGYHIEYIEEKDIETI